MPELPNFEPAIQALLVAIGQFIVLSALLVGILNSIKELVSDTVKKYFFLVAIVFGVGLVMWITAIFPELFPISTIQAIFFGVFVGLGAVGFYELGLGKKKEG